MSMLIWENKISKCLKIVRKTGVSAVFPELMYIFKILVQFCNSSTNEQLTGKKKKKVGQVKSMVQFYCKLIILLLKCTWQLICAKTAH